MLKLKSKEDRQILFAWKRGSIRPETFTTWREAQSKQSGSRRFAFGDQHLLVPPGHLIPELDKSGRIVASISSTSSDPHCDFRPVATSLDHGFYTRLGSTYRVDAEIIITPSMFRWSQERKGWAIALQFWGPRYAGFHQQRNPPLALMLFRGMWRVQQYGCPIEKSKQFPIDASSSLFPVSPGKQRWSMIYRPSLKDGQTSVRFNGDEVFRYRGPNAIHGRIGGQLSGPGFLFGCYADRDHTQGQGIQVVYEAVTYVQL